MNTRFSLSLMAAFAIGVIIASGCGFGSDRDHDDLAESIPRKGYLDARVEAIAGHNGDHIDGENGHAAAVNGEAHADTDLVEVTLVAIEGREWGFAPSVLELPVGRRVRLTLINPGDAEHDVEIARLPAEHIEAPAESNDHSRLAGGYHDESVVATHAMPGGTATVLFTPTEPGEYEFACTIPGHREAGMIGKLVVTN